MTARSHKVINERVFCYHLLSLSVMLSIIVANFNGNPATTIISCYSPTNVVDEDSVAKFFVDLSSLVRSIPKHNLLLIGRDFNAKLSNEENNIFHHTTNRNGKLFPDFALENQLQILNTKLKKKKGKLWTFQYPSSSKGQLDNILING